MSASFGSWERSPTWRCRSKKSRGMSNNVLKQCKSGKRILHFERTKMGLMLCFIMVQDFQRRMFLKIQKTENTQDFIASSSPFSNVICSAALSKSKVPHVEHRISKIQGLQTKCGEAEKQRPVPKEYPPKSPGNAWMLGSILL